MASQYCSVPVKASKAGLHIPCKLLKFAAMRRGAGYNATAEGTVQPPVQAVPAWFPGANDLGLRSGMEQTQPRAATLTFRNGKSFVVDMAKHDPYSSSYNQAGQQAGPLIPPYAVQQAASAEGPVATVEPYHIWGRQVIHGAKAPNWLLYDKQVLRFYAYFLERVEHSPLEAWRVRRCQIRYFLEDTTLEVIEPREPNSGLPQGTLLHRNKVLLAGGRPLQWSQLAVGYELELYSRKYQVVGCDAATRAFMDEHGLPQASDRPYPEGQYDVERRLEDQKAALASQEATQRQAERRRAGEGGEEEEENPLAALSTHGPGALFSVSIPRNAEQEANAVRVLRFMCCWDDTARVFGLKLPFALHYYVGDDTLEVVEVHRRNGGRDPFPLLLSRRKLPKTVPPVGGRPLSPGSRKALHLEYYKWKELRIGKVVKVYGRDLLIYDMDESTRAWYRSKGGLSEEEMKPIPVDFDMSVKRPAQYVPPHTSGIGSEEDSRRNVTALIPKAPKLDYAHYLETWNKVMRFSARMVPYQGRPLVGSYDNQRRFIVSFHLLDSTMAVYEPPQGNSGIKGGIFLERVRVTKPGAGGLAQIGDRHATYSDTDLQVGGIVVLFARAFELLDADEATLHYMEKEGAPRYPYADYGQVLAKARGVLSSRPALVDQLRSALLAADVDGLGYITARQLYAATTTADLGVTLHEVITLVRRLGADRQGLVITQLLDALGLEGAPPRAYHLQAAPPVATQQAYQQIMEREHHQHLPQMQEATVQRAVPSRQQQELQSLHMQPGAPSQNQEGQQHLDAWQAAQLPQTAQQACHAPSQQVQCAGAAPHSLYSAYPEPQPMQPLPQQHNYSHDDGQPTAHAYASSTRPESPGRNSYQSLSFDQLDRPTFTPRQLHPSAPTYAQDAAHARLQTGAPAAALTGQAQLMAAGHGSALPAAGSTVVRPPLSLNGPATTSGAYGLPAQRQQAWAGPQMQMGAAAAAAATAAVPAAGARPTSARIAAEVRSTQPAPYATEQQRQPPLYRADIYDNAHTHNRTLPRQLATPVPATAAASGAVAASRYGPVAGGVVQPPVTMPITAAVPTTAAAVRAAQSEAAVASARAEVQDDMARYDQGRFAGTRSPSTSPSKSPGRAVRVSAEAPEARRHQQPHPGFAAEVPARTSSPGKYDGRSLQQQLFPRSQQWASTDDVRQSRDSDTHGRYTDDQHMVQQYDDGQGDVQQYRNFDQVNQHNQPVATTFGVDTLTRQQRQERDKLMANILAKQTQSAVPAGAAGHAQHQSQQVPYGDPHFNVLTQQPYFDTTGSQYRPQPATAQRQSSHLQLEAHNQALSQARPLPAQQHVITSVRPAPPSSSSITLTSAAAPGGLQEVLQRQRLQQQRQAATAEALENTSGMVVSDPRFAPQPGSIGYFATSTGKAQAARRAAAAATAELEATKQQLQQLDAQQQLEDTARAKKEAVKTAADVGSGIRDSASGLSSSNNTRHVAFATHAAVVPPVARPISAAASSQPATSYLRSSVATTAAKEGTYVAPTSMHQAAAGPAISTRSTPLSATAERAHYATSRQVLANVSPSDQNLHDTLGTTLGSTLRTNQQHIPTLAEVQGKALQMPTTAKSVKTGWQTTNQAPGGIGSFTTFTQTGSRPTLVTTAAGGTAGRPAPKTWFA